MLRNAILALLLFAAQQPAGSIQGVVVQAGTNTPLGNAMVELRASNGSVVLDSIATSADGVFAFTNVRPGQYRLSAARPGFIKTEYGQRQSAGPTVLLTVTAGQRAADVRLVMTPGGIISGRVTEKGKPVGIADVFAIRVAYYEGEFYPTPVLSTKTNDLGEYKIFWLPPGRYYIATMINDFANNSPYFINPDGDNNSSVFSTRFPMRAVLNRAVGSGAGDNQMHVPTFFPGTVDPDKASQIEMRAGGYVRNVDISAPALPVRHVRGNVVNIPSNAAGQPFRPNVSLMPLNLATALGSATIGSPQGQTDPNNAFDLERVYPGQYALAVTAGPLSARVPIEVRDGDVNGILVNLGRGLSIQGRVTIERPTPITPDPAITNLRVDFSLDPIVPNGGDYSVNLRPDGTFQIPSNPNVAGLLPGNYRVTVPPLLQPRSEPGVPIRPLPAAIQNAYVKSIRLGDRDVINDGLPMQSSPQEALEIVLGMNPGSIEGRVLNSQQQPAGAVWVALIPENKLRYRVDHKFASTTADGRFEITSVPPGDYKIFAWEDIEKLAWQEPDVMRPYESRGKVIHVDEGKKAQVEVLSIPPAN